MGGGGAAPDSTRIYGDMIYGQFVYLALSNERLHSQVKKMQMSIKKVGVMVVGTAASALIATALGWLQIPGKIGSISGIFDGSIIIIAIFPFLLAFFVGLPIALVIEYFGFMNIYIVASSGFLIALSFSFYSRHQHSPDYIDLRFGLIGLASSLPFWLAWRIAKKH